VITDKATVDAFLAKIKSLPIYRHADSYARCRDTFWIESFNHALLTYLPKRIHFGDLTYQMRMDIAVMDWNENVDREVTSEKLIVDGRRPNRRLPFKCRKAKTDNFRWKVWWRWVHLMNGLAEGRLAIDDDIHQSDVGEDDPLVEIFHPNPLVHDEDDDLGDSRDSES
jgi:hypothetical protein